MVEDGFRGGNIVAADFAGTPEQLAQVRENLQKSDWVGRIVSGDQTAAMVVATLMENDPETGQRLDLQDVAKKLEAIRANYENDGTTSTSSASPRRSATSRRAPSACSCSSASRSSSPRSCLLVLGLDDDYVLALICAACP